MGKRQLPFAGEVVILKINTKWILEVVSIMINKFFRRAKRMEETIDVKGIETEEFPKTLGDLAKTDHLFYRFSQSSPGRSEEKVFAQYIPGQITEAKDNEKYLSFVTEKTIASCFMYGDMITRLNFNLDDEAFKKIANTPIKYIGNALGEYESKYLLVEQNYSLRDITTIEMLFELVQNSSQLNSLFYFTYGSLDQRLHEFGYKESEQLVKYLKEEFNKNIHITPDDMRSKLREYIKNIGS
ncbi:hypothetical protein [Agathobacter rectalis]|jgi:hypothetical protein|uniref:Uncharacterized protein n=2 Tax=Lachnospiraceae TaxID=186803 RepID=A0A2U2ED93_9FIRM|nr:hypothetical protein [Agathobacter rectalis]PWE82447.1 hypothetical protein LD38_15700 [Agathobacter rectalis]